MPGPIARAFKASGTWDAPSGLYTALRQSPVRLAIFVDQRVMRLGCVDAGRDAETATLRFVGNHYARVSVPWRGTRKTLST